ncbi:Iggfc-Binding Protein [Manis pentadactyla]|nr:Iggfc-Binding Protein [Manis pentadactyla]
MRTRNLGGFPAPWICEQQAGRAETQALPALALSVSPGSCPVHAATVGMLRLVEQSCPENSHWETCANFYRASCPHEGMPLACHSPCHEGCMDDAGFLSSGGACSYLASVAGPGRAMSCP